MKKLKNTFINLGLFALVLIGCFTIPASVYFYSDIPQVDASPAPAVQVMKPTKAEIPPELMLILRQIADKPQPTQKPVALQTSLQPVPDPLIMAFQKQNEQMSQVLQRFAELENRFNTLLVETAKLSTVDRSGNTSEALDDIHADVVPPELPDPLVKALAKYPGARVVADPDTGEYIPAVTEWRETNWGGGKQLHLLRHKGKVFGQTVLHKSKEKKQEAPAPQPSPFRSSN